MSVSNGHRRVDVSLFCFAKQLMVRVTNQCPGSLRNQSPWDDRFLNRTLVGIARLCRHGRRFLLSVPRKGLQPRVSKAPGSTTGETGAMQDIHHTVRNISHEYNTRRRPCRHIGKRPAAVASEERKMNRLGERSRALGWPRVSRAGARRECAAGPCSWNSRSFLLV